MRGELIDRLVLSDRFGAGRSKSRKTEFVCCRHPTVIYVCRLWTPCVSSRHRSADPPSASTGPFGPRCRRPAGKIRAKPATSIKSAWFKPG